MKYENLAKIFVEEFPEYRNALEDHISEFDEILNHVFFGDTLNAYLVDLIKNNEEKVILIKLFDFFERMLDEGDIKVQEVLIVTILEYLGDDPIVLKSAYAYMGEETKKASDNIERQLGRLEPLPKITQPNLPNMRKSNKTKRNNERVKNSTKRRPPIK